MPVQRPATPAAAPPVLRLSTQAHATSAGAAEPRARREARRRPSGAAAPSLTARSIDRGLAKHAAKVSPAMPANEAQIELIALAHGLSQRPLVQRSQHVERYIGAADRSRAITRCGSRRSGALTRFRNDGTAAFATSNVVAA